MPYVHPTRGAPRVPCLVTIKRMRYTRCTPVWLEREADTEIAGLRIYPLSHEIPRELWICSPKYLFRFFRVSDTGLAELGRDGEPLPQKSPVPEPEAAVINRKAADAVSSGSGHPTGT